MLLGMVVSVTPLPVGNALRIQIAPPAGATIWRVLRNDTNFWTDAYDAASAVVGEVNSNVLIDATGLVNGTTYYYKGFYFDGEAWTADPQATAAIPAAGLEDSSTDALSLVRDRLASGMANEVAAGNLTAGEKANGVIAVLTAPPIFEDTNFPVIVVHMDQESPAEHGIGELVVEDELGTDGQWHEHEGWLARTTLSVTGWCLNPDARIEVRKALRRQVIGNLPVLNSAGLREIEFSQSDQEDLTGTYGAPMYFTVGTLACLSPIVVGGKLAPISDVTVNMSITPTHLTADVSLGSP